MPSVFQLECIECGRAFPPVAERLVCEHCNAKQKTGEAVRGILELRYESFPDHFPADHSLEGWKDWLPLNSAPVGTGLVVGATPLHSVPRLRELCGMPALWVKDDTRNPSASTKDRASWLVCQKAKEFNLDTVATASTGNAASALACMSAAFDLNCRLFVPSTAPIAKLHQMRAFGAELCLVEGDYDAAYDASMIACAEHGWYNRNTAWNPYTIEGKKTAALEILAQLYPAQPDTIILSSGDGVILHGVIRGLHDMKQAGLISTLPRVLAIQSTKSDALYRGWKANNPCAALREGADSVADSLNVNVPRDAYGALKALKSCGGDVLCVSDEAVLEAICLLAKTTGIFAEPAGATALAGCLEARDLGILSKEERVVLLVTGSGLKDPGAAQELFPPTESLTTG
jgi:threonine synthase